jgi:tRNA threonylcarbamoyladenosine biosynthesis protein TsaB
MALLLHIDTALETGVAALSEDERLLHVETNDQQMDHAGWLHPAIEALCSKSKKKLSEVNAVSVSIGPGSYTGLRVGLAAAKGYAFALKIPLITVGTLEIMAHAVKDKATDLICPLIDARRMEAYAAIYDKNLVQQMAPLAMILHMNSFESLLSVHELLFCGNGIRKLKPILKHPNAAFIEVPGTAGSMSILASNAYSEGKFADIAYTEPLYLKDFHSSTPKT